MHKYIITIISVMLSIKAFACSPYMPEVTPPDKVDGEFKYDYYTKTEQLTDEFKRAKDVAVVTVDFDMHSESYPRDAITKLIVRYGWGKSYGRTYSIRRHETSCGLPEKLEEHGLYVAIFKGKDNAYIYPYNDVKDLLKQFGNHEYKYTSIGITR